MILVDTSIWIDHLQSPDLALENLLDQQKVLIHMSVIGELAVGGLKRRDAVLWALRKLPRVFTARDDEVMDLINREKLFGTGIGYIDAHLLASTLLTVGSSLWTRDKRLHAVAIRLAVQFGSAYEN